MRLSLAVLTMLLLSVNAGAQNFHVNLFAGTSNYQGDLQDKRFTFSQSHFAGGAGFSYDLSDKFSIRSAVTFARVSADDKFGRNAFRNLNFTTNITEVNLGLEYYITPLAAHALTPYVFAGLALYHFDPYTHDTSGQKFYLRPLSTEGEGFINGIKNYHLTQFAIPFGGGVKLSLTDNINVGIEFGLRKLFTDYLDDISRLYVDQNLLLNAKGTKAVELAYRGNELKNGAPYPPAGTIRGGSTHKDWYYFTGLTISFKLGSGGLGTGSGRHQKYGCPANVN
ncbi:MAG: porin family protein [Bacteroidota bacterium]|nr:porin family protein [Bacteroidota bacterium]